jgi:hypothetical protein
MHDKKMKYGDGEDPKTIVTAHVRRISLDAHVCDPETQKLGEAKWTNKK